MDVHGSAPETLLRWHEKISPPDTWSLQHYLGHKNIQHTVRYTEMALDRFKDFWRD